MNVYKFGGASVKDAEGVKNLFKIINTFAAFIIFFSFIGCLKFDYLFLLCGCKSKDKN